jgi:L-fuconolactonase
MSGPIIDIHPHIISTDTQKYPHAPLFGIQSDWSKERPVGITEFIAAMDEAGVSKAAIVHASTCYGFDNSYVADAVQICADRCTAVGSIDLLAPGAVEEAKSWFARGITGLRIFTGGSTKEVDASILDDPKTFPVWELMNERGLSMCIQTDTSGIPATISLAKRFTKVPVLVDHFARPDARGGAPFDKAGPLFSLAGIKNIYLKFTPVVTKRLNECGADVQAFMSKLVAEFGSGRIAWGSNWPNSPGTLAEILAEGKAGIAHLSQSDQDAILGGTALKLYPVLKG